jgi:hypothetical protein
MRSCACQPTYVILYRPVQNRRDPVLVTTYGRLASTKSSSFLMLKQRSASASDPHMLPWPANLICIGLCAWARRISAAC